MERNFKNKTKIIRTDHSQDNHYTCISNLLIQDKRLNVTEKGLMLMLLSNADEYILNTTYFRTQVGIGVVKFNECIRHLIELGYLIKKQIQGGVKWIINESPSFTKSESSPTGINPTETSPLETSPTGNEPLISNNEIYKNEMRNNEKSINEINSSGTSILGEEENISNSIQVEEFSNHSFSSSDSKSVLSEPVQIADHYPELEFETEEDLQKAMEESAVRVKLMTTKQLREDLTRIFEPYDWYSSLMKNGVNKFLRIESSKYICEYPVVNNFIELLVQEFYNR